MPPLEAGAAGVQVIVTECGSTDDYVDPSFALTIESQKKYDNEQHYLEPNLDSLIDQLVISIERKNTKLNVELARKFMEQKFSWKIICDELSGIMQLS